MCRRRSRARSLSAAMASKNRVRDATTAIASTTTVATTTVLRILETLRRACVWRSQRFSKERTVTRERPTARPIVDHPIQLEAARRHLVDHDLRGNPVAATVLGDTLRRPWPQPRKRRWKIDHRQDAAGTDRPQEAAIGLCRVGHMMVDAAQDDGVATIGGQAAIASLCSNDRHIVELGAGDCGTNQF